MLPLFRGRNCSLRGIPRFTEESIPRLGTEENTIKNICFTKNPALSAYFCPRHASERNSESLLLFFSTERNSEHFSPLRNGSERNSESFLFRGMVQNEITRVCFYFCSMVQNSEHFSPLWNGSDGIPRVFCSAEQPEFRRYKPIVPSFPSSAEYFFCRKLPTLDRTGGVTVRINAFDRLFGSH
jgi:hypothetical protein